MNLKYPNLFSNGTKSLNILQTIFGIIPEKDPTGVIKHCRSTPYVHIGEDMMILASLVLKESNK